MNEATANQWLEMAGRQLSVGGVDGAISSLCHALGDDPDMAEAHALLSVCLTLKRRLHAAEKEAGIALGLQPDDALAHFAMGTVQMAQRRFGRAEEHFRHATELEPSDADYWRALASLQNLTGRRQEAFATLQVALKAEPDSPSTIAALGDWHLQQGSLQAAETHADEALALQPEHCDALVLKGHVLLRKGRVEEAREHAVWALRINAMDVGALGLMTAIKARSNPFLGLWWRYSTWMSTLGESRSILVMLGAYVVYRFSVNAANDLGQPSVGTFASAVWLAICVYTWIGPALFQRALQRELAGVELGSGF